MKHLLDNEEYLNIILPILENKEFLKLKNISHHDNNRLYHSLRVSYYSYLIAKKFSFDYVAIARAGLLHDFYLDTTKDYDHMKDKVKLYTFWHPKEALLNAKQYFELSSLEEDIIITHMFPLNVYIPKHKESWVLNVVDSGVSFYEFTCKFSKKTFSYLNFLLFYVINFIRY